MDAEKKTKIFVTCFTFLACLILCGCYEEQSYFKNKRLYYVSLEELKDAANRPTGIDEQFKQDEIDRYSLVVNDALNYVHKNSTEQMKHYISRGRLVIGMNQKEVLACLYTRHFINGLPVPSKTYNSKYGKYETWLIGDSSEGIYSSCSPPKYALDFTCFILTGIHET